MRTIRTLTAGLACAALLPAVPPRRRCRNRLVPSPTRGSGARRAASTMFGAAAEDISAPTVGGEWMITRTKIAMYVSVEQSFFDTQGGVFDPTSAGSTRIVDIKDSRRYNVAAVRVPEAVRGVPPVRRPRLRADHDSRRAAAGHVHERRRARTRVFTTVNDQSSRTTPVLHARRRSSTSRAPRCSCRPRPWRRGIAS